ncbi:CDF family Co(II)/Ni(II) efflux transporter DmeF [Acinetobacter radioresistens]|uniref:CDF family Co(II)/Ni(II) efflux transporter DmeF n=2 Tax=Acinetobacter TaxID=469 RepID=UPI002030AFEA|nr:CDF family Co(II)/Ni(II) efflux transporter DmeF [Acinetobacter radioresistens]MCM1935576.1 CDF family Co(II)/Ni(II) efflux transporter DmeF [Acinetobacter radioresistens]MCM1953537.1 CDF family Co(II)/Ni(II) efflux transporter DmeF [Acinetobacter radioresistens]
MQNFNLSRHHKHQFDQGNPLAQKRILWATLLTGFMMLLEISGGWLFNSMALLADGWHMSSHMLALGLAYLAYRAARHYANDQRFSFGTWKIEILAGYSSAILLIVVALYMAVHSVERLIFPVAIHYNEAIPIAVLGLLVNLLCAWLLHDHTDHHHHHHHHHHEHEHEHEHEHRKHSHDLNQKAAFLHVVADAVTSVFAIIALLAGKYFGCAFLDAVLGVAGAVLVARWAWGLIRDTGRTLLDAEMDHPVVAEIREVIVGLPVQVEITDLHVWKVGRGKFACILALETQDDLNADQVRDALSIHEEVVHISVEINMPL